MDYEKERREAIAAGNRALSSLEYAKGQLSGARTFGILDILGGQSFTSLFKHIKIDNARRGIEQAKRDLMLFNNELCDLSLNLNIDIGTFLTICDFMDSFIADVWVQSKIAEAQREIDQAILEVKSALNRI